MSTSATRWRPPTRWYPSCKKKGVKSIIVLLHEGVTPTDATSYNACTGVSGAGLAIAQNLSPKIDAVVSGHTHQAYNCVVKDPKGNPRLFTSASSFGRMVTKLHFLIDPKTATTSCGPRRSRRTSSRNASCPRTSSRQDEQADLDVQDPGRADPERGDRPPRFPPATRGPDDLPDRAATPTGGDSPLGNLIADSQKADPSVVRNGRHRSSR